MNLRKQVEPLKKAALQASSLQRHAHHAASRLTWVKRWLKRAYRHHAQSREPKRSLHPSQNKCGVQGAKCEVRCGVRSAGCEVPQFKVRSAVVRGAVRGAAVRGAM